jgi:hypothetical protein
MPRKMVFDVWERFFPDRKPRVLQPRPPIREDQALDRFCRPLAACRT